MEFDYIDEILNMPINQVYAVYFTVGLAGLINNYISG